MSGPIGEGRRPLRADARRSIDAILDASIALLGRRPDAAMDDIAAAAGVSRQTIYAHFPSRKALLAAMTRRLTAEAARELDDLDLERVGAADALARWLDASWGLLTRFPVLLTTAVVPDGNNELELHAPITGGLVRVIERGRRRREFDRAMPASWYVAAIIALGHAAGQEVAAGRMSVERAGAAFRDSALKICRATPGYGRGGRGRSTKTPQPR